MGKIKIKGQKPLDVYRDWLSIEETARRWTTINCSR